MSITKDQLNAIYEAFHIKIKESDLIIAYEVHDIKRTLLSYMDPRLSNDKVNWIERKRNVVLAFAQSSLSVTHKNKGDQDAFLFKYAYDNKCMTLTAGSIPILNEEGILLGAITVTGLSPQDDHDLAEEVLQLIQGK